MLAPLIFCISWCLFMMSKNFVINLTALLAVSLVLPMVFMQYFKTFWPCGLILILMSTGLIVIFAYIVSLHPSESVEMKVSFIIMMASVTLLLLTGISEPSAHKISHWYMYIDVSPSLSLLLISLLLYLVVSFIRNVYSKGGGFRKKF